MRHTLARPWHAGLVGCLFASLVACTGTNPDYMGPTGDQDLAGPVDPNADLAGPATEDLTSPTEKPDLSDPPPECRPTARRCRTSGATAVSQACDAAGRWRDDRQCPADSACANGYCQVPVRMANSVAGTPCGNERDCTNSDGNQSCAPFVVTMQGRLVVISYCARSMVAMSSTTGTQCKPPDGSVCRTGFCDEVVYQIDAGSVNYCLRRCSRDSDCPTNFRCRPSKTIIEGQPYAQIFGTANGVGSCTPN